MCESVRQKLGHTKPYISEIKYVSYEKPRQNLDTGSIILRL